MATSTPRLDSDGFEQVDIEIIPPDAIPDGTSTYFYSPVSGSIYVVYGPNKVYRVGPHHPTFNTLLNRHFLFNGDDPYKPIHDYDMNTTQKTFGNMYSFQDVTGML